jgi:cytoskeletal protein CcmA (bactofilin family)
VKSPEATEIARGTRVEGQISGDAELVVDGEVHGEIRLQSHVVVGKEGLVHGTIIARTVEVSGRVVGNVEGVEKVEVLASGSLEGDVASARVMIADGAFFKGKIDMVSGKGAAQQKPQGGAVRPAGTGVKPSSGGGSATGGGGPTTGGAGAGQNSGKRSKPAGKTFK